MQLLGLKSALLMAQFKPALAINPDILARYAQNRMRVVRQVHYSLANMNNFDLVLFLNGVAVATVEHKTDFAQSITDALINIVLSATQNQRVSLRNRCCHSR